MGDGESRLGVVYCVTIRVSSCQCRVTGSRAYGLRKGGAGKPYKTLELHYAGKTLLRYFVGTGLLLGLFGFC